MSANVAYLQDSQALDQLQGLFDAQRRAYVANPMPPAAQRQQWLKALRELLSDERQALINAISQDPQWIGPAPGDRSPWSRVFVRVSAQIETAVVLPVPVCGHRHAEKHSLDAAWRDRA